MPRKLLGYLSRVWIYPVVGAALVRMFRGAMGNSRDFQVYWEGVTAWLGGTNPYAIRPENIGFVFKYPPWSLPLFIPIGIVGWEAAKVGWFIVELGCLALLVRWLIRHGVRRGVLLTTFGMFWWLILAHVISGQFTLVTMAGLLWASDYPKAKGRGAWRWSVATYLASVKVFGLVALAGAYRRVAQRTVVAWTLGAGFAGMVAVLLVSAVTAGPLWQGSLGNSIQQILRDWSAAAGSGGKELGEIIVRGQGNHGLPALVLRTFSVSAMNTQADTLAWAMWSIVLGLAWWRASKSLEFPWRWSGWLALSVITHPLAWHHSFVMTIPLCAMSLEMAWRTHSRRWIVLSLLGTFMIAMCIPQVVGMENVRPLELAGVKSWGTLLCAVVLVATATRDRRRGARR